MKYCTMCKEQKATADFYYHPNTNSRLQSQCKSCIKIANKTRLRAYRRVAHDSPVDNAIQSAGLTITGVS